MPYKQTWTPARWQRSMSPQSNSSDLLGWGEPPHLCKGEYPVWTAEDEVELTTGQRFPCTQATECLLPLFIHVGLSPCRLRLVVHHPFGCCLWCLHNHVPHPLRAGSRAPHVTGFPGPSSCRDLCCCGGGGVLPDERGVPLAVRSAPVTARRSPGPSSPCGFRRPCPYEKTPARRQRFMKFQHPFPPLRLPDPPTLRLPVSPPPRLPST